MIREEKIQIPFNFAAGTSGSRFLTALRDSQVILGAKCNVCTHVTVPLKSFCPSCCSDDLAEMELPAKGRLISWTDCPGRGAFALIQLGDKGPILLHRLIIPPSVMLSELNPGMPVTAHFSDSPKGHISDLQGFVISEK